MRYLKTLNMLWLVVLLCGASVAQAAPDLREMQAREAFGAGRYQDALDLFAKLYAQHLDPVYLRNIGRCYQNLQQPDRAISSFREYMRKGKNIKKAERAEIEGYISEMEELKKTQEAERNAALKPELPATTAPAAGPPHHRLGGSGAGPRRCRTGGIQHADVACTQSTDRLPGDPHDAGDPCPHPGESASFGHSCRQHHRCRPAVLPVDRGQGGTICRAGAA